MISSAWLVLTGLGRPGYLVSSKANDSPDSAARIMQKMDLVDAQIPETLWIGGDGPVVADFFATEAFEVMGLWDANGPRWTKTPLGPGRDLS